MSVRSDVQGTLIVLFRNDLRVSDNPALLYAAENGCPVLPVFVFDEQEKSDTASYWWRLRSVQSLYEEIGKLGGKLAIFKGKTPEIISRLVAETGATTIYYNKSCVPKERKDEELLGNISGLEIQGFNGNFLHDPESFLNKSGTNYKIFTPFYKAAISEISYTAPLPAPSRINFYNYDNAEVPPPYPENDYRYGEEWKPGESGAFNRLQHFIVRSVSDYADKRDFPSGDFTSKLSAHLHFGEISPRQTVRIISGQSDALVRQLYWREFCNYLLFHHPDIAERPLQEKFENFPWRDNKDDLNAWKNGETGYPLVDAGMRQLLQTGWMHNRVRMVCGSFLVKHLLLPWQEGEKWFRKKLLDYDAGNNAAGWQWIAGCGTDAAPYFRIFNPITQSEKFDASGKYIREFVPELADMPDEYIHTPWKAPKELQNLYTVRIVEHTKARARALESLQCL